MAMVVGGYFSSSNLYYGNIVKNGKGIYVAIVILFITIPLLNALKVSVLHKVHTTLSLVTL